MIGVVFLSKKRDKNLGEIALKIGDEFGIPKPFFDGMNHIEMTGNKEAIIDKCLGIIEYSEERIKLNLGKNTLCISGNGLCIKEYGCQLVKICGTIISAEFG